MTTITPTSKPNHQYFLAGLVLVAFALRTIQVDAFGFWIDEALTPLRASYSMVDILRNVIYIQDAVSQDTHPPLYYLLIHMTALATGMSDLALRLPSVWLGTLLVPIIYQLGRRVFSPLAGLMAALLVAISPLQIWYSQEARMYTLLMVLVALTLYWLWPLVRERRWRSGWVPYLICLALAAATHLSAAFWAVGHALLWSWIIWPARWGKNVIVVGGAAALAGILALPWLAPRLFSGAEAGYTYLPPWIMFSDLFTGFGLGVTPPRAVWFTSGVWWILLIGAAAAVWDLWHSGKRRTLTFVLVNVLSVLVVIALISLVKPLYQGIRHIMVGYPAWVILMGHLAARGWEGMRQRRLVARPVTWSGLVVLLVLIGAAAGSYVRLRTDPLVAKDHFREAIAYVEAQAAPGDLVLYNNAIAMLIHWHYATRDDLTITALPTYPHYSTPDIGRTLEELLIDYDRVWYFPGLPNDGRDDERLVGTWLNDHLPVLSITPFFSRGTILQVVVYNSRGAAAEAPEPVGQQPADWPTLQGVELLALDGRNGWVELVWEKFENGTGREMKLSLLDRDGRVWATAQQPIAPSLQPENGSETRRMMQLPLPTGLPPGSYTLQGELIADGQPAAAPFHLLDISFDGVASPREDDPLATFGVLELMAVEVVADEIRPGYAVPFAPIWRSTGLDHWSDQYSVIVSVRDPKGHVVYENEKGVGSEWMGAWPPYTLVRDPMGFRIPVDAAAARYTLHWQVRDRSGYVIGADGPLFFEPAEVQVGEMVVAPWPIVDEPPAVAQTREATWDEFARLHGYTITKNEGEGSLQVALAWESTAATEQNLFVFVHVVDPESGEIVTQSDWFPADGLRPTNGWRTGEYIVDTRTLSMGDVPAGEYVIYVGMYDPGTDDRPGVMENGVEQPDRQLRLEQIVWP